ncbi:UNVERIFIED_CONTAM: hypothetical protein FKN15_023644 [Acipenser sinensis]
MDRNALAELLQALESRRDAEERRREERYTALIERHLFHWKYRCLPVTPAPHHRYTCSRTNHFATRGVRNTDMDRNALAELLQALESRRDAEERRREERYTALIERVGLAVAAATTPTTTPRFHNHNRGTDRSATHPDIPSVMPPLVASATTSPPIHDRHIAYRSKALTSSIVASPPFWMADFRLTLQ